MRWKKIYNDKYKRNLFKNLEVRFISIKSLLKSQLISLKYKSILERQLYNYDTSSFSTKIKNICIFTGRHRGVYRLFRISRIELRNFSSKLEIFGLKKSSW